MTGCMTCCSHTSVPAAGEHCRILTLWSWGTATAAPLMHKAAQGHVVQTDLVCGKEGKEVCGVVAYRKANQQ